MAAIFFSVNEDKLKADVQFLAQKFASSDLTRQACEAECQKYMDEDKELNVAFGCPIACMGYELNHVMRRGFRPGPTNISVQK